MSEQAVELTADQLVAGFGAVAANISDEQNAFGLALLTAWQSGDITDSEFVALLADQLAVSVGGAMLSADALVAVYVNRPALGMVPDDAKVEQLTKAAKTVATFLDDAETDPLPRVQRLAVAEPLDALQQASLTAYSRHGITGYVRGISADACELCVWLKKEHLRPGGYIYPTDKPMHKHPGCTCVPIPITC
ncbi:MAG TPA: hypothetical protein VNP20_01815 [Nocardioidaceae bacterium]|nr:hypothetical protein [Nocardioidaceae bacterium]